MAKFVFKQTVERMFENKAEKVAKIRLKNEKSCEKKQNVFDFF